MKFLYAAAKENSYDIIAHAHTCIVYRKWQLEAMGENGKICSCNTSKYPSFPHIIS